MVIVFLHGKVIQGMPTLSSLSEALWSMIIIQKYELVKKWALVPGSPAHVSAQLMKTHLYKSAPCHVPLGRPHPAAAASALQHNKTCGVWIYPLLPALHSQLQHGLNLCGTETPSGGSRNLVPREEKRLRAMICSFFFSFFFLFLKRNIKTVYYGYREYGTEYIMLTIENIGIAYGNNNSIWLIHNKWLQ